ncbi:MAG: hypothetical protein AAB620_02335 [Patescibacteria group bacterium]
MNLKSKIDGAKIKTLGKRLKGLPLFVGERAFLSIIIVIFIELVAGGLLFYKYSVLPGKIKIEISENAADFNKDDYERVVKFWEERSNRSRIIEDKVYYNPFKPLP